MNGVALERHGDSLVAAKRSESPERLAHEADLLQQFHHPGVVEFMSFSEDDEPLLITAWAGTDTWERRCSTDLDGALQMLAAITATVADLHTAGISHRSLSPSHVIIANDGRPVLCGFGNAGPADDEGLEADRNGLRNLVAFAAESIGGQGADRLKVLTDWLSEPHSDPAGFVRVVDSIKSKQASPRSTLSARPIGLALAGLALAVVAFGFVSSSRHDPVTAQQPRMIAPTSTPAPTSPPAPATFLTTPPTTTLPDETLSAALTQSTDPLILQHDGRRYGLGTSDDLAVVGDWNCDGQATPAMLQRSTGVVAVFDAWPEPGGPIEPQFTVPAPDIESLQSESSGECDVLRARSPYGSRIIIQEIS